MQLGKKNPTRPRPPLVRRASNGSVRHGFQAHPHRLPWSEHDNARVAEPGRRAVRTMAAVRIDCAPERGLGGGSITEIHAEEVAGRRTRERGEIVAFGALISRAPARALAAESIGGSVPPLTHG